MPIDTSTTAVPRWMDAQDAVLRVMPDPVERWELSGGTWQAVSFAEDRATVELLRCDGGEIAEVLTLREPRELRRAAVQAIVGRGAHSSAEGQPDHRSAGSNHPGSE